MQARSNRARALACYRLALFHDNNSREREAIRYYEEALRLGLDRRRRSEALAWLASSLFKTGRAREALVRLKQSRRSASLRLSSFLRGLEARIKRSLA